MTRFVASAARVALVVASVLTLASCGSGVQFVRQDSTRYPSKPSDAPVEVRDGGTMTPHVVIGTFTAERDLKVSYGDGSNLERVMEALRKEARKVGADALVNVHPVMSDDSTNKPRLVVSATAIRYLQEKTRVSGDDSSR